MADVPYARHHSPPTLTKTWFHVGPVAAVEADDWTELDLTHEYWPDDTPMLTRPVQMTEMLAALPRRVRRDALRALRGHRVKLQRIIGIHRVRRISNVHRTAIGQGLDHLLGHFRREQRTPLPADEQRRALYALEIGVQVSWRAAVPASPL